jgi:hypothetical protein
MTTTTTYVFENTDRRVAHRAAVRTGEVLRDLGDKVTITKWDSNQRAYTFTSTDRWAQARDNGS